MQEGRKTNRNEGKLIIRKEYRRMNVWERISQWSSWASEKETDEKMLKMVERWEEETINKRKIDRPPIDKRKKANGRSWEEKEEKYYKMERKRREKEKQTLVKRYK